MPIEIFPFPAQERHSTRSFFDVGLTFEQSLRLADQLFPRLIGAPARPAGQACLLRTRALQPTRDLTRCRRATQQTIDAFGYRLGLDNAAFFEMALELADEFLECFLVDLLFWCRRFCGRFLRQLRRGLCCELGFVLRRFGCHAAFFVQSGALEFISERDQAHFDVIQALS